MTISTNLLEGISSKPGEVLECLKDDLLPKAVKQMNEHMLPREVQLLPDDKLQLPTNQRNLTDFRTRIGTLLEYELAQAINASLPTEVRDAGLVMTYVVANQFPDLAFRTGTGKLGVRFEVKAIQTVAEEKSANFSTLIKDIRKGTDFVVVLLWEWNQHPTKHLEFPRINAVFVMDAYHLAHMRDCYWLNNPPKSLQSARQGFDLTFAVNAKGNSFNEEEHNLGKLMRIFDPNYESYLPAEVRKSETLQIYYQFTKEATRLGLLQIGQKITAAAATGGSQAVVSEDLPVCFVATPEPQEAGDSRQSENAIKKGLDRGHGYSRSQSGSQVQRKIQLDGPQHSLAEDRRGK